MWISDVRLFLFDGSRQTTIHFVVLLLYFLKMQSSFLEENHSVAVFELQSPTQKRNYNFTFLLYV